VTCVDSDAEEDSVAQAKGERALVVRADGTQVATLKAVRVDRARAVVCACADDATNARVAALASGIAGRAGNRELDLYVHVADPELAKLLRAAGSGLQHVRLHFFNVHDVWARALLDQPGSPFLQPGREPPSVLVVGTTALGRALTVTAARRWHRHARANGLGGRARIVLAGPDSAPVCDSLVDRYPALPATCDLVPADGTPDFAALAADESTAPTAVYACLDDRGANLAHALEAEYAFGGAVPIYLPASAAAAEIGGLIVRTGRIHAVPLPTAHDAGLLLHDRLREPLARRVHAVYLETRRHARDFGARPADHPWEELSDEIRRQNRAHADAIVDQLRAVWFEIAPLDDWDEAPVELSPGTVDALAELEHSRWCRDRLAAGFRYAPERDDAHRLSDLLVPWEKLRDGDRDDDRALARERPRLFHELGYRLERSPARETLARAVHDRYLAGRQESDDFGELPADVDWENLPEDYRERNRANVDDIGVKLDRIGRQVVPLVGLDGEGPGLGRDEILQLAQLEHERWLGERLGQGWTLGPRDDAALNHPDLVPWDELGTQARQKDVDLVAEIPALLATAGYGIARNPATM